MGNNIKRNETMQKTSGTKKTMHYYGTLFLFIKTVGNMSMYYSLSTLLYINSSCFFNSSAKFLTIVRFKTLNTDNTNTII